MQEYVDRLVRCGFTPGFANDICTRITNNYGMSELEVYVHSVESLAYGVPCVD